MIKLKYLLEISLKTKRGSRIERYKNNVGKYIGGQLYVHRLYANQVIPEAILSNGISQLKKAFPTFKYNCIMWDSKKNVIRFDEAPDFDTAQEVHVGDYVVIILDGKTAPMRGHSDNIWHHKWMWVKDDYKGFDVEKSKQRSKQWLDVFDEPAKGTDLSWNTQLDKYGIK